jgi:hypothetical protein
MKTSVIVSACDVCLTERDRNAKPEPGETVRVGLDGITYELEICERHGDKLRQATAAYTASARKVRAGSVRSEPGKPRSRTSLSLIQNKKIRQWCRDHGIPVSEKGRISVAALARYEAEAGRQ